MLPGPKHFEQVGRLVTKDMTRDAPAHGPDVGANVAAFRPFADAGSDEIYLSQIGRRDDNGDIAGSFDFYWMRYRARCGRSDRRANGSAP